jgi:hypothetical protein
VGRSKKKRKENKIRGQEEEDEEEEEEEDRRQKKVRGEWDLFFDVHIFSDCRKKRRQTQTVFLCGLQTGRESIQNLIEKNSQSNSEVRQVNK